MNNTLKPSLAAIAVLLAGLMPAGAQDVKNYSWSGTSRTPPSLYAIDSNGNPPPTYEMANNRLHAANPGSLGAWSGKQFDWPADSFLADNEMISGSVTFRINSDANSGGLEQRLRLFTFNVPWANGMAGRLTVAQASSCTEMEFARLEAVSGCYARFSALFLVCNRESSAVKYPGGSRPGDSAHKKGLHTPKSVLFCAPAWTPRVRLSVEAEMQKFNH